MLYVLIFARVLHQHRGHRDHRDTPVEHLRLSRGGGEHVELSIDIVRYEYMALAKKTSVLREAMLLPFEAFEVRIAKCCKQR